jgi:hypothetical protein
MMRMCNGLAAAFLLLMPAAVRAQNASDIHIATITLGDRTEVGAPWNATDRDGYDNQPWFLPDGSAFLYVSSRDGQTDVFRYNLGTRTSEPVTRTPENEYSPSLPGDGSRMMVVRWANDMSTGGLWWYTPEGVPLEEVRGSVERVGYYALADERTLALFINDSIQSFLLSDARTGDTIRVGQDMGGSGPRVIPGERAVSWLRAHEDGSRWLTRVHLDTREATPITQMLDGVANYMWTSRGTVLAARGSAIYEWTPDTHWRVIANFEGEGIAGITRIALDPAERMIAFVAAR